MTSYADLERRQYAALKQKYDRDMECISCPKCSGQWFEDIFVGRFREDHNLALGQQVPMRKGSMKYILLKCIYCGNLLEPRVQPYGRDPAGGDYDHLLDTMEGKFDQRKEGAAPSVPPLPSPPAGYGEEV